MASRIDEYGRFFKAATAGKRSEAKSFVTPKFRATLSNQLVNLSFERFMEELDRRRESFPDLGKHVYVTNILEDGDRLVVTHMMTVTLISTLRHGSEPKTLQIPSQDRVIYVGNKINELEIVTDPRHTIRQLFPF